MSGPATFQPVGMPKGITLIGYTPSTLCSATTPDAETPAVGGSVDTPTAGPVSPVGRGLAEFKFTTPTELSRDAHVRSMNEYRRLYEWSVHDPEGFWKAQADNFSWFKRGERVGTHRFTNDRGEVEISYFKGWETNMTVNALDRHVEAGLGDRTAIIWEGNEPGDVRKFTYRELLTDVQKFANVLKSKGVKRGDPVTIYMPMVPELAIAMLACARIGAPHSIVFGGFSADSLADRIFDAQSSILITTDGGYRGAKTFPMKTTADAAMKLCSDSGNKVETCIVYKRTGEDVPMAEGRDTWWHDEMKVALDTCPPEHMDGEDPLFILYTSGSTGKPKGVLHTTGGYMVYAATTHRYVFDYKPGDIYWCTADIGWITGHSYIIYGPLSNGATTMMFEGVPNYPDAGRFWDVVERHRVNQFYTAPTAIRALMGAGNEFPEQYDLSSLRILGTVGEPINPAAWRWYHRHIGKGRIPIVDTWWQTETGGILISPLPGATPQKPGSATRPLFGIQPTIIDGKGYELPGVVSGRLAIKYPWPGMLRTVWGNRKRFLDTYFPSDAGGRYFTGDGAKRDADGYYWITGRIDDVINVSGHRMGTAEIESALVKHRAVSEAAVVGYPHDIKGQSIYAFVTLASGHEPSEELRTALVKQVRDIIGPIATPDAIQFTTALPKTRSGKIMRRVLRKIAANITHEGAFGDTSTLADPAVLEDLVDGMIKAPHLVEPE